jgi:hypothetical protein
MIGFSSTLQLELEKELLRTIELQIDPDLAEFSFGAGDVIHLGSRPHETLKSIVFSERGNFSSVHNTQLVFRVVHREKKYAVEVADDAQFSQIKETFALPAVIQIQANPLFEVEFEIHAAKRASIPTQFGIRLTNVVSEKIQNKVYKK